MKTHPFRTAAALLAAAVLSRADAQTPESVNLHRVRVLLGGDARAIWIGDSWARLQSQGQVPYGSLMVWPIGELQAICAGNESGAYADASHWTTGVGRLQDVDSDHYWVVDYDPILGQQFFGLPVLDATRVHGQAGLGLDGAWPDMPRIQALQIENPGIDLGNLPPFATGQDLLMCRPLFLAPVSLLSLLTHVQFADGAGTRLGIFEARYQARPFWHLGETPGDGTERRPLEAQINALSRDLPVRGNTGRGPTLVTGADPAHPLVGSADYWMSAGAVFYKSDAEGRPLPGYYHSGLGSNSWSFAGLSEDRASNGGKNFSDQQLLHWLDVTTLSRDQTPVVILHVATEDKERAVIEGRVRRIIERFRWAYAEIGGAPPRFLLLGSYMHEIRNRPVETSRMRIEELDEIYERLAATEPDCAYFSIYRATDGVFFSVDYFGGPGNQQLARDWLDDNGWSTITFGGRTYTLSSRDDGGLDGNLLWDGLHSKDVEAGAFFARLIGDAIASATCDADFDGDGTVNTVDFIAFLNAWAAREPSADFNGDGTINTVDVIAFLGAWSAGC